MVDSLDVSVIVVSWNTRDVLRNCLASVYTQTQGVRFEMIVVDNASSDGSTEMVRQEFPTVTLIENRENRGFASACNQGIVRSSARYVLLLNSDAVILDHAIEKCVSFADQRPEAATLGCRTLNVDGTLQPTCFKYPSLLNMLISASYLCKLFPRNPFCGRESMTWWDHDEVREVEMINGSFMLVRREAIEQVGALDEVFFMYAEEADWCYRFAQAGWVNLFYPDAHIIHLGGESTNRVETRMLLELRISILKFCRKHYSTPVFHLCGLMTIVCFLIRIPHWVIRSVLPTDKRKRSIRLLRMYVSGIRQIGLFMARADASVQDERRISPGKY